MEERLSIEEESEKKREIIRIKSSGTNSFKTIK